MMDSERLVVKEWSLEGTFCYVFAKTLRLSCADRDMAYPYLPT